MKRYFSYSEYNLWNRNRDEYYRRYILGEEEEPDEKMRLGTIIHRTIEDPRYNWLYELRQMGYKGKQIKNIRKLLDKAMLLRPKESEVTLTADLEGVKLLAIFDGLDKNERILDEFKTTDNNDSWHQWRVDWDEQLSFYALVYYFSYHKYFREIRLHRINTTTGTIRTFYTIRSLRDVKEIEKKIKKTISEIKEAGWWEKRLSRKEIGEQFNLQLNFCYEA